MAGKTSIEWTDATWNPVHGCTRVSPGCQNCYAERQAARFPALFGDTSRFTPVGPRWNGLVSLRPEALDQPLRWREPKRIFVCSMSDLFHEQVPDEFIFEVLDVAVQAHLQRGHILQFLTKRPARMKAAVLAYIERGHGCGAGAFCQEMHGRSGCPLPDGLWFGVSVENQSAADERIPQLLQVPAALWFVSVEPMLGSIRLRPEWLRCPGGAEYGHGMSLTTVHAGGCCQRRPRLRWVIAGGESGPGARPMHPDWVRSLRDQCQAAGVPFFFKQAGTVLAKEWDCRNRKGGDITEWPEKFRQRQFPSYVFAGFSVR